MILEFFIYVLTGALLVLVGYNKGKKDGSRNTMQINDAIATNIFKEGYNTGFSMCRIQALEDLPVIEFSEKRDKKTVSKKKKSK